MTKKCEKLCPFDKEPCIGIRCAVWNENENSCSFAILPMGKSAKGNATIQKEHTTSSVSTGLSGKFRDPLFG